MPLNNAGETAGESMEGDDPCAYICYEFHVVINDSKFQVHKILIHKWLKALMPGNPTISWEPSQKLWFSMDFTILWTKLSNKKCILDQNHLLKICIDNMFTISIHSRTITRMFLLSLFSLLSPILSYSSSPFQMLDFPLIPLSVQ